MKEKRALGFFAFFVEKTSSDAKNMFECIEQTFRMLRLTLTLFIFHKSSLILLFSCVLLRSVVPRSISPQGPPLEVCVGILRLVKLDFFHQSRYEDLDIKERKRKKKIKKSAMTASFFFDAGRVTILYALRLSLTHSPF